MRSGSGSRDSSPAPTERGQGQNNESQGQLGGDLNQTQSLPYSSIGMLEYHCHQEVNLFKTYLFSPQFICTVQQVVIDSSSEFKTREVLILALTE